MRIVYLCEFGTLLGGERSLLTFLDEVRSQIDIEVVCPATGLLAETLEGRGIAWRSWPGSAKESALAVGECLADTGVDLVHANSLSLASAAITLARRIGCRCVVHVRDVIGLSARQWEELRKADAVIAVSEAVASFLYQGGITEERVHVVANGVTVPKRRELAAIENLSRPRIACIGQISLRKGQDVFVQAAKIVSEIIPTATFVVMGERYSRKEESIQFESRLHEEARLLEDSGRWLWLGYQADAADLLWAVDVVAVPSRQEPLSRVALEALACGRRVVATDVGGSGEILDRGRLGWLVPVDDAVAMAKVVVEAVRDETRAAMIAEEGPRWINERFSPSLQVQQLMSIYRALTP